MNNNLFIRYKLITVIVIVSLSMTGCINQGPQLTFINPTNGETIPYHAQAINLNLVSTGNTEILQVYDNGLDATSEELFYLNDTDYVNNGGGEGYEGTPINAQVPNAGYSWDYPWYPESYGKHVLRAHACAGDTFPNHCLDWITETVCIVPDPNSPAPAAIPVGDMGNCVFPPTITPTPNPIDSVQAYPNPIYYGNTCPSLSTVTFRAAITLPNGLTADQVQVAAHASFIITSPANPSGSLLIPLLPDGTWDSSSGGQVFLGTAALTHSYNDANNQVDLASLGGSSGAILWYVTVTQNNASGQARSANQVLSLSPCPTSGHNPPHNGSGAPTGCGQYTNQTSCNLAGCSWNPQNSSCTVNP